MSERKEQILAVAVDLVRQVGFHGLRYQDISEALGMSRINIHHHFCRKEDLGQALIEYIEEGLRRHFDEVAASGVSAWEKLERFLTFSRGLDGEEWKNCPVSALNADASILPESVRAGLHRLGTLEVQLLERLVEEGRSAGEFNRRGSAQEQAQLILSSFKGALIYLPLLGPEAVQGTLDQLRRALAA